MQTFVKFALAFIATTLLLFLLLRLTGLGIYIGPTEMLFVLPVLALATWWAVYRGLPGRQHTHR